MSTMTYRDTPVGFHRLYKAPLDNSEILANNAELLEYCSSGSAYAGQRVTVNYGNFCQEFILKGTNDRPTPIIVNTPANDFIYKIENGLPYVLVYYYNGGSAFTNGKDSAIKFDDPFAYSQLVFADILANSTNITFLLESVHLTADESSRFTSTDQNGNTISGFRNFTMDETKRFVINQPNPLSYDITVNKSTSNDAEVLTMGWVDDDPAAYIITENPSIFLMPKIKDSEIHERNIIRLWVSFHQYYSVWKEGKD